ncbi:MAG: transcription-repair coupling factor [Pseudomonadota bacterium]
MPALRNIVSAIAADRSVSVIGARGSSAQRLAVEAARETGRKLVLVCADRAAARQAWMNLYHMDAVYGGGAVKGFEVDRPETCGRTLLLLPPLHSPYQDVAGDFAGTLARQSVLMRLAGGGGGEDWRYLVMPAEALLMRVPGAGEIGRRVLTLSYAKEIEPFEVAGWLEQQGYHKSGVVESPGTFATRGGMMDIYAASLPLPVRVQWYGPLVERMRFFNPDTQRTEDDVQEISIPAASEISRDEGRFEKATEEIRTLCERQDISTDKTRVFLESIRLPRWMSGFGIRRFLPAFYDGFVPVADLLGRDSVVFIVDPGEVFERAGAVWERLQGEFEALREKDEPAFEPGRVCVDVEEARGKLEKVTTLHVYSSVVPTVVVAVAGDVEGGALLDMNADDHTMLLRKCRGDLAESAGRVSLRPLARQIREWLDGGVKVTLTALGKSGAERLRELLQGHGVAFAGGGGKAVGGGEGRAALSIGPAALGYFLESEKEALVTEEEIFGKKTRRRKSFPEGSKQVEDLRSLKPSDHVVHKIHGVGVYDGQVLRTYDGNTVELIKIVYRDGDILYVPVYNLNQVQKFIGGKPQVLDKLGGETFLRTKKKSQKAAFELAERLLQLYASRKASPRQAFTRLEDEYLEFESLFPYEDTPDQQKAVADIMDDFEGSEPMDRLLCGDVGFGKTEVAIRAAWRVAMTGRQVAVLVPTTVLCQQHLQTFRRRFAEAPVVIEALSRFQSTAKRRDIVRGLKEGRVDIVIGTHRLLSGDVYFKDLGLLIIDEEHRFGVAQKERIKFLRPNVDVLTMTATPIPRTLQMSIGRLLSLSLITTPPAHRLAIRTQLVRWNDEVIAEAVKREIGKGGQVFFLHNRVESIGGVVERLRKILPAVRFDVAHGQMKPAALERVMVDFVSGKVDVLVCTAIIESGLDIPNANTMFINDVHTFGLAQLYQIRGRIGRASHQAYAYLILPERVKLTPEARERLDAIMKLAQLGSGFGLAAMDLEIRGAGDLLGKKQSGHIRKVGFELFCEMLDEATSTLRGEEYVPDIEPEIRLNVSGYIPDDYIEDAGLRLAFYKRMAGAKSEGEIWEILEEIEDRFGDIPAEVRTLREVMVIKVMLRRLAAYGIEAGKRKIQVHLSDRSPLTPDRLIALVQARKKGRTLQLTPDRKLILTATKDRDPITLSKAFLTELLDGAVP